MADPRRIALHRCRFVDWSPSPITALALAPARLPSSKIVSHTQGSIKPSEDTVSVLAVGRSNGNVEIWRWIGSPSTPSGRKSEQGWVLRQTFFGPRPSKVDSLAFAWRDPLGNCIPSSLDDLRLFSTTGGSELLEWDLSRGVVKHSLSSQGGSIWSLAVNPTSTLLAIGCEDGCVRLISIEDGEFNLQRKLDRVKCRILSIAWGPPHVKAQANRDDESDDEEEWEDTFLVTGCSDSSLRKWDVKSGRVLERMSTDRTRSERTLVWAVGVLADGTIVSGDSMGMVKFWDANTSTQLQSFTAHGADILCLEIGPTGNAVYTSGVDQRVVEFLSVEVSAGKPSAFSTGRQRRWIQSCSRRLHSHDVRALAMWPAQSTFPSNSPASTDTGVPILVSGGLDMSPVFTPSATPGRFGSMPTNPFNKSGPASFEESHYHRTPFTTPVTSVSAPSRLVACRQEKKIGIWRILETPAKSENDDEESGGWVKVLEMELKFKNNISSLDLSNDGTWLAVADVEETKLFRLKKVEDSIEPRRIKSFPSVLSGAISEGLSSGATSLCFSPDSTKLAIGTAQEGFVVVVDISSDDPKVLRVFNQHRQPDLRTRLTRRVHGSDPMEVDEAQADEEGKIGSRAYVSLLSVSPDGQWLASSDADGKSFVFHMDSLRLHCALPTIECGLSSIAFDPKLSRYLLLTMPNNTLRVFDVESKSFPTWQNEFVRRVGRKLSVQRDPIIGASFVPLRSTGLEEQSSHQSVVVWGANWMCRFRIFPKASTKGGAAKRGREEDEEMDTEDEMDGTYNEDGIKSVGGQLFLTVFTQYRNMVGVHFLDPDEMVVIERPLLDVLSHLPPAYFKAKYGT